MSKFETQKQILCLLPDSNVSTGWKDKSSKATLSRRSCRCVNFGKFGELRLHNTQRVHESPHEQSKLGLGFSILDRSNNFLFCHCCTDLVLADVQELIRSVSCWTLDFWTFNNKLVLSFSASSGMLEFRGNAFSGVKEVGSILLLKSGWTFRLFSIFAVSTSRSLALLFAIETIALLSTCLCLSRCTGVFLIRTALYVSSHLRIRRSMSMTCDRSQVHFDAMLPRSE
jgi:hypothetical protein